VKAPIQDFSEALRSSDEQKQKVILKNYAAAMRQRVQELGENAYWEQFEVRPDLVGMFLPGDNYLSAAFEQDPKLREFANHQRVFFCTPLMLLTLLKSVAYGWQQRQVVENARQIASQGRELYEHLSTLLSRP
jgi:DNA recombination protein RmuC